jgi:hypothetical protein
MKHKLRYDNARYADHIYPLMRSTSLKVVFGDRACSDTGQIALRKFERYARLLHVLLQSPFCGDQILAGRSALMVDAGLKRGPTGSNGCDRWDLTILQAYEDGLTLLLNIERYSSCRRNDCDQCRTVSRFWEMVGAVSSQGQPCVPWYAVCKTFEQTVEHRS